MNDIILALIVGVVYIVRAVFVLAIIGFGFLMFSFGTFIWSQIISAFFS